MTVTSLNVCLQIFDNVGFLFVPFMLHYNPISKMYEQSLWKPIYSFVHSILICASFVVLFFSNEYPKMVNIWYFFELSRHFLWEMTPLVIFSFSLAHNRRIMNVINQIPDLPSSYGFVRSCVTILVWSSLIYYLPFLVLIYFFVLDLQFSLQFEADLMSDIAYNLTTLNILYWCFIQLTVLYFLKCQLRIDKLTTEELHAVLTHYDAILRICEQFGKTIGNTLSWLLLFLSIVFACLLFYADFFVTHIESAYRLQIYVLLADAPLTLIFYVFTQVGGVWKTVRM